MSFAHAKGLVHRDVKPSNVLVSARNNEDAIAKIIDFGIAMPTSATLEDSWRRESSGPVGTIEYMSPEQALGLNKEVDQRSDIYALGVLMFELLTAQRPRTRESILESARTHSRSSFQSIEPETVAELISRRFGNQLAAGRRREISWIVARCLKVDQNDRYVTCQALCDDLENFVIGRAVNAAPPSAWYRISKQARQYPITSLALVSIFIASIAFASVLAVANRRTRIAYQEAKTANTLKEQALIERNHMLAASEATTDFVISMLDQASPQYSPMDRTVKEMIDFALDQVEITLHNNPSARYRVRSMLSNTLRLRGDFERALQECNRAAEDALLSHGQDSLEHADILQGRSQIWHDMGKLDRAREDITQSLAILEAFEGSAQRREPLRLLGLAELAELDWAENFAERSTKLFREVVTGWAKISPDSEVMHLSRLRLAEKLALLERSEESAEQLAKVEAIKNLPPYMQGNVLAIRFKLERSLNHGASAFDAGSAYVDWCEEHYGETSPRALQGRVTLAQLKNSPLSAEDRLEELKWVHTDIQESLGEHPLRTHASMAIGETLRELGRPDEALPWLTSAIDLIDKLFPEGHSSRNLYQRELALSLIDLGWVDRASEFGLAPSFFEQVSEEPPPKEPDSNEGF